MRVTRYVCFGFLIASATSPLLAQPERNGDQATPPPTTRTTNPPLAQSTPEPTSGGRAPERKPALILPGETFEVAGRPAFVLLPAKEKRQTPQPWIFYAPAAPAYPDQHEKWMHEQFLNAGVAVAGIDVGRLTGVPKGGNTSRSSTVS